MTRLSLSTICSLSLCIGFVHNAPSAIGANDDITWTGAGDGSTFSDDNNWDLGGAMLGPEFSEANDSLKFNSAGTTITNDLDPATNSGTALQLGPGTGTEATSAAFHFLSGSGDFTFDGFGVTAGSGGNDGVFRADAGAGALQTFNIPITLAGGNKRRKVVMGNNGTVVFNGDMNFTNSLMFIDEVPGRIELNGANTGVGPGHVSGGTNGSRTVIRNDVNNTVLSLGSDTALGDVTTGTWDAGDLQLRGLVAVDILFLETDAPRDLSGYMFSLNDGSGGGAIRFDSVHDVSIGYLMRVGNGGRSANITEAGVLTIEDGVIVSNNDQAQSLGLFASGAGGQDGEVVINGRLFNTLIDPISAGLNGTSATGGIDPTKQIAGIGGSVMINGNLNTRNGQVTFNGDSSSSWIGGQVAVSNNSTAIVGNDNAFGDSTSYVGVSGDSTIDLNGHTISQTFLQNDGDIINSNESTAGEITTEMVDLGNPTFGGAGDITVNNIRRTNGVTRRIFKQDSGILTLAGDQNNNRYGLEVNGGTVRLAKDDGAGVAAEATSRFDVEINNGSTVLIANYAESELGSGVNDQIADIMLVNIVDGTLDLGGNTEGIGRLSGAGVVESNGALAHSNTEAILAIGATANAATETAGASSPNTWTWGGTIQDGDVNPVGVGLSGGVRQIFTGNNTYSGSTTVSNLVPNASFTTNLQVDGSIPNTSQVTVDAGMILSGTGSIASPSWDINGTVQPGGETPTATDALTLDYSSTTTQPFIEIFKAGSTISLALDANEASSSINLFGNGATTLTLDNITFDFTVLGAIADQDQFTLFDGDASTNLLLGNSNTLTGLTGFEASTLSVVGNDLVLNLAAGSASLDGDYNDDGSVDLADYTIWRNNLGAPDGTLPNDGSLMTTIGTEHYNLWRGNYGASNALSGAGAAAVPEPTSIVLVGLGSLLLLYRRVA